MTHFLHLLLLLLIVLASLLPLLLSLWRVVLSVADISKGPASSSSSADASSARRKKEGKVVLLSVLFTLRGRLVDPLVQVKTGGGGGGVRERERIIWIYSKKNSMNSLKHTTCTCIHMRICIINCILYVIHNMVHTCTYMYMYTCTCTCRQTA